MMEELDEFDKALLQRICEKPGLCVREIIRPFLIERSESALRARIQALELRRLIRTAKTKREVRCFREGL